MAVPAPFSRGRLRLRAKSGSLVAPGCRHRFFLYSQFMVLSISHIRILLRILCVFMIILRFLINYQELNPESEPELTRMVAAPDPGIKAAPWRLRLRNPVRNKASRSGFEPSDLLLRSLTPWQCATDSR